MRKACYISIIIMTLFILPASASVPEMINYQGYLKQDGVVVTGTKSMTFSLYGASTGGAQLCSSGAQSVAVTNGLFSYKIGSAGCDLSTINWDNPVYIEVAVDGVTMTPREQIAGMSYLVQTLAADVAFTPAGNVAATDVQGAIDELDSEKLDLTGGTVTGTITATAFVGDGSGLTGISAAALDHNTMGNLTVGDPHTQYFNLSQSETVTGIPAFNGGTTGVSAPFTVDSTFLVTNLNADLLDGQEGAYYLNTGTSMSGDVSGIYSNIQIGSGVVGSTEVTDASLTATDLLVNVASSVDGVTNDGGDIDLIAGAGVAITPDDTANTITIAADANAINHNNLSNLTAGDPHTQYFKKAGDAITGQLQLTANTVTDGVSIQQDGSGRTLRLGRYNTAGTDPILYGDTNVQVPFIAFSYSGNTRFFVDYTGNVYATGTVAANAFSGDGSALTNIAAGSHNHDTSYVNVGGDTMTGALAMSGANGDITFDDAGGAISNSASAVQIADDFNVTGAGTIATDFTVDTNTLYVDSTNNRVGIGTITPANNLDVEGGAAVGATYSGTSAAPANGLIVEGSLGIGTSNPASGKLQIDHGGATAMIYGTHTGAGGNLIHLRTGAVDTFVVDHNGVITTSGCPAGFTAVAGNFCILSAALGPSNWYTASENCRGFEARLCSIGEQFNACRAGGIGFLSGPTYWVDEVTGGAGGPATFGHGSATCAGNPNLSQDVFASLNSYYCCRVK